MEELVTKDKMMSDDVVLRRWDCAARWKTGWNLGTSMEAGVEAAGDCPADSDLAAPGQAPQALELWAIARVRQRELGPHPSS